LPFSITTQHFCRMLKKNCRYKIYFPQRTILPSFDDDICLPFYRFFILWNISSSNLVASFVTGMAVWRVAAAGNITKASDWPYYSGLLVSSVNSSAICTKNYEAVLLLFFIYIRLFKREISGRDFIVQNYTIG